MDGDVDCVDLAIFILAWLTQPGDSQWNPDCDIGFTVDNHINLLDFAVFSTNYSARTVSITPGDFNKDGNVDMADLAIFTSAWLSQPRDVQWNPDCDIGFTTDNHINLQDFAVFSGQWHKKFTH